MFVFYIGDDKKFWLCVCIINNLGFDIGYVDDLKGILFLVILVKVNKIFFI